MVLPHRRRPTHPLLLPRSSLPPHTLALRQHPHCVVRKWLRPTNEWDQFHIVGSRRFYLSMVHEALPLPLVVAVQLYAVGWTGGWCHHRHVCYILFTPNEIEWRYQRQLVGQFCMEEHGRCAVNSSQDSRSGRKIWTEHVVVIYPILYFFIITFFVRLRAQNHM